MKTDYKTLDLKETHLSDYKVPPYLVETVHLWFDLYDDRAEVRSKLVMIRNPKCKVSGTPELVLDGEEMELRQMSVDGVSLSADSYALSNESVILKSPPSKSTFTLEIANTIKPQENKALEGLYRSNNLYCTQCEAEGFRRITYYIDRPDNMATFTVTVSGDKTKLPVLLSNGNLIEEADLDDGRHKRTFHDPFKKPAHLFALVAGDLAHISDTFKTFKGRNITLEIFSEQENIAECEYGMGAIKRAMKWDEDHYGREYDLDRFVLVAVNDFNMGAMENKGLNVFNTSCILASKETATDARFKRVESVIAHEYFHNWTGNRVNLRDWFQLTLKEGLTVFRDQKFSQDTHSETLCRIEDVAQLRTRQFAEDSSQASHPIQPKSFLTINNFYTATVYEKGAEVIRMLHTILGNEAYRKGTDLYFDRHDGQAITTEEWIKAHEDANDIDLSQFRLWYDQKGTPKLKVSHDYNEETQAFTLNFAQENDGFESLHIPIKLGLVAPDGSEPNINTDNQNWDNKTQVFHLKTRADQLVIKNVLPGACPSILRGFSAPVYLEHDLGDEALSFLMKHDSDGFNRFESAQHLMVKAIRLDYGSEAPEVNETLLDAFALILERASEDKAFAAHMLSLPSESYLSNLDSVVDVDAIHGTRKAYKQQIAKNLENAFKSVYTTNLNDGKFSLEGEAIGQRALKNAALHYLCALEKPEYLAMAQRQFEEATDMTNELSAFAALVMSDTYEKRDEVIEKFYAKWKHRPLVVDAWFSLQASRPHTNVLEHVEALEGHEAFDAKNPNKLRALVGAFCANEAQFHRPDGKGYEYLAQKIKTLDAFNPQMASRFVGPFMKWRKYDDSRQELMKKALEMLSKVPKLSKDVQEMVAKSLAA